MTISVTSPDSNNKKIKINKELLMRLAPLFSLIILVLFFSFSSPFFFNTENIMTIALQTSVIGIMAIGVTFVIITAGIDLSLGSVVAFSGVAVGILRHTGPAAASVYYCRCFSRWNVRLCEWFVGH